MSRPQQVLVVRRGALGDTILMVPALRLVRARLPEHSVHFAGNLDHAAVLLEHGVVDAVRSSEDLRLWEGPAAFARLDAAYTQVLAEGRDFDARLDDTCPHPAAEEFMLRIGARVPGTAKVAPDAALVAARTPAAVPPLVVVAPGAGSPKKRAPLALFANAIVAAHERDQRVALVLGEVEEHVADALISGLPPTEETWRGLSVVELARRLAGASAFVGNDSGVTHLAAALLVPTTAFFVSTRPEVWAPRGPHVTVVQV